MSKSLGRTEVTERRGICGSLSGSGVDEVCLLVLFGGESLFLVVSSKVVCSRFGEAFSARSQVKVLNVGEGIRSSSSSEVK